MGQIITIDYDELTSAASNCSNVSSELDSYKSDLTTFAAGFSELPGGSSAKIADCEYYISAKTTEIDNKANRFLGNGSTDLSTQITALNDYAQDTDTEVANLISGSTKDFCEWKGIETSLWTDFTNWLISIGENCPVVEFLVDHIRDFLDDVGCFFDDVVDWYRTEGGREIVGLITAIVGAVAAVALCVLAFPAGTLVAICGAILAVIGAVSAIVNVVTSAVAVYDATHGDPTWARIRSNQNTIQDVLRQTNFGDSKVWNIITYGAAGLIDITEIVCSVITIGGALKDIGNICKQIKIKAGHSNRGVFKILKSYITNVDITGTDAARRTGITHYGDLLRNYAGITNTPNKWAGIFGGIQTTTDFIDNVNSDGLSWGDIGSLAVDIGTGQADTYLGGDGSSNYSDIADGIKTTLGDGGSIVGDVSFFGNDDAVPAMSN